jgi:hypothetical protein
VPQYRQSLTGLAGEVAHLTTAGVTGQAVPFTEVFADLGLRQPGKLTPCMESKPMQVAQEHDLSGLPCLLTLRQPQPGDRPRDQEEDEPQAHDR